VATKDLELVKHALKVARDNGCSEVEIAQGAWEFKAILAPGVPPKKKSAKVQDEAALKFLKSPYVGYFGWNDKALKKGQKVDRGDTIGVITSLGIENDVEANLGGEILEVLVKDGDPVEYGQPIASLKP
jgi:acetyl-CoA carboxylase biotin carboxyl carrier protein